MPVKTPKPPNEFLRNGGWKSDASNHRSISDLQFVLTPIYLKICAYFKYCLLQQLCDVSPQHFGRGSMSGSERSDLEKEVAGEYNTFRVYLYMLKAKKSSARDIQKALGFSSTWLATHHLEKLEKLGLVTKDRYGDYNVLRRYFGVLRFFFITGKWIVPRMLFFVLMFGVMMVGFLAYLPQHPYFVVAFVLSIIGLVVSIYETIRFFQLLPKT